jgi:hypothetical protein
MWLISVYYTTIGVKWNCCRRRAGQGEVIEYMPDMIYDEKNTETGYILTESCGPGHGSNRGFIHIRDSGGCTAAHVCLHTTGKLSGAAGPGTQDQE